MIVVIAIFVNIISVLNTSFLIKFMYNRLIADHYGITHLSFSQVLVCYMVVATLSHETKPITDYGILEDYILTAFAKGIMLYVATTITLMIS